MKKPSVPMYRGKVLDRRTFLHGMGRALALPLLDAMIPSITSAAVTPKRFFSFYIPNGSYMGNKLTGRLQGFWVPGANFMNDVPLALEPLRAFISDVLIVSNLENASIFISSANYPHYQDFPTPVGVDADGSQFILPFGHGQTGASFLTCCAGARDANGYFLIPNMPLDSLDQILVKKMKDAGDWNGKSFVASCISETSAPSNDVTSRAYGQTNSFLNTQPVFPMYTVQRVLDSFFINLSGGSDSTRKKIYDLSYMQHMRDSANSLKAQLGVGDRRLLDQYLSEVNDLETMATQINASISSACTAPTGGPTTAPVFNRPLATAHYVDFAKFVARAVVLGMKCDKIRVGNLSFGNETTRLDFRNIITGAMRYNNANMEGEYHLETAHHKGMEENIKRLVSIHHLQVNLIKEMVVLLKAQTEGPGSMLDNTLLMTGLAIGDGNNHSKDDLVRVFIGGKNLGIQAGRHIDAGKKQVSAVYLGVLRAMGYTVSDFGKGLGRATSPILLG